MVEVQHIDMEQEEVGEVHNKLVVDHIVAHNNILNRHLIHQTRNFELQ
jgi:hypothetical protein